MSKPTATPWQSDLRSVNWKSPKAIRKLLAVAFGDGYYTITAGSTLVAMTLSNSTQSAANARLMSASAELRDALLDCLKVLDTQRGSPLRLITRTQARRALAKAGA